MSGIWEVNVSVVEAADLPEAFRSAYSTAKAAGEPYALELAPTSVTDDELLHEPLPALCSVTEAARILKISRQAVNDRLKTGNLPGSKVGSTWIIPLRAVLARAAQ